MNILNAVRIRSALPLRGNNVHFRFLGHQSSVSSVLLNRQSYQEEEGQYSRAPRRQDSYRNQSRQNGEDRYPRQQRNDQYQSSRFSENRQDRNDYPRQNQNRSNLHPALQNLFRSLKENDNRSIWQYYKDAREQGAIDNLNEREYFAIYWKLSKARSDVVWLEEIKNDMEKRDIFVQATLYQDLIIRASAARKLDFCEKFFNEMKQKDMEMTVDLYRTMIVAYYQMKRFDEAFKTFETAKTKFSNIDALKMAVGICHFRKNEFDEAIRYLEDFVTFETKPRILEQAFNTICSIYIQQEKFEQAEKVMERMNQHQLPKSEKFFQNQTLIDLQKRGLDAIEKEIHEKITKFDFQQSVIKEPFREEFRVLISQYIKSNNTEKVFSTLKLYATLAQRIPMNTSTRISFAPFKDAIKHYCDPKNAPEAMKIYEIIPPFKNRSLGLISDVARSFISMDEMELARKIVESSTFADQWSSIQERSLARINKSNPPESEVANESQQPIQKLESQNQK